MTAPVPPGALVVHARELPLLAGGRIGDPDDDLGVLAAQFDDAPRVRVERLDGKGDGVHLLDEPGADERGEDVPAAARDESAGRIAPAAGTRRSIASRNSSAFSAWRVSWRS